MKGLIKQAQRLFSSKKNGGKLVYKLTDRLHCYKQNLIFLSIALLLGYSQFRTHFECTTTNPYLSKKDVTSFCWINGTYTLNLKKGYHGSEENNPSLRMVPHNGIHYKFNDGKYELTNHNYMRSLWALLILMAGCSYLAQQSWCTIFNNEVLKALLKLPGHEVLSIVKTAQEKKPLDLLMRLKEETRKEKEGKQVADQKEALEPLSIMIEVIEGDQNEHNHTLDYYVNQLIYLLLVKQPVAYKMSGLKLRRKLLLHSITSFILTLNQLALPWLFIGNNYLSYGYDYAQAWFKYMRDQWYGKNTSANTIDYELSSRIFPTMTTCEYIHYGPQGTSKTYISCFVGINEICGKMFAVIWWFVAINLVIEALSLAGVLVNSIGTSSAREIFGAFYWPDARKKAKAIATFRYNRGRLHNKQVLQQSKLHHLQRQQIIKRSESAPTSVLEKKQLELEAEKRDSSNSLRTKKWYLWCSRDIGLFLRKQGKRLYCFGSRGGSLKEADRFRDSREELNVYYLFYLLYLRLQRSSKKTNRIIMLIAEALNIYLDHLRNQLQSGGSAVCCAASLPAAPDKQQPLLLTSFGEVGNVSSIGRKSEWLTEALTLQANQQSSKSSLTVFEDPEAEGR